MRIAVSLFAVVTLIVVVVVLTVSLTPRGEDQTGEYFFIWDAQTE